MSWVIEDADNKPKEGKSRWVIEDAEPRELQPSEGKPWMRRMQERPFQTAVETVAPVVKKVAPYVNAAAFGQQAMMGGGGPGDFAAMPSAVAKMAGAKLPTLPENVPAMGPTGRFGPVIGAGVQLGEAAVNKIYPGSNISEKIPDKSLGYLVAGAMGPGAELKTRGLIGQGGQKAMSEISKSDIEANRVIDFGLEKGLRPKYGKSSFSKSEGRLAVRAIVDNKDNLQLKNQFGEEVGSVPQTLKHHFDSIDQTQGTLAKQFTEMAKSSGQYGSAVNYNRVADNFVKEVEGNETISRFHPELIEHAKKQAAFLRSKGGMVTTEQAQKDIAQMNAELEKFYNNTGATRVEQNEAKVDALMTSLMRKEQNDVIDMAAKVPGSKFANDPSYQELRRRWGALQSIRDDSKRAMMVDARKANKALIDFSDIASGAELVKSLARMDPVGAASAAAMKGIAWRYKYLNNPNTEIKNMYSTLIGKAPGLMSKVGRAAGMAAMQQVNRGVGENISQSVPKVPVPDLARTASADELPPSKGDLRMPQPGGGVGFDIQWKQRQMPNVPMNQGASPADPLVNTATTYAKADTRQGYDNAIKVLNAAIKRDPSRTDEIQALIDRYSKEKRYAKR